MGGIFSKTTDQPMAVARGQPAFLHHIGKSHPPWKKVTGLASQCVGMVRAGDRHLGCGILVGVNRVLVPLHVIAAAADQDALTMRFETHDDQYCYLHNYAIGPALDSDETLDFCIMIINKNNQGYPGETIPIPRFSCKTRCQESLLVHADKDGSKIGTICIPCPNVQWESHLCTAGATAEGSSGGCHFTKEGYLIAMHLKRASGECAISAQHKVAIYIDDILKKSAVLRTAQPCQLSLAPPYAVPLRNCFYNVCFIDEGKPPVMDKIPSPLFCSYWEVFPTNCIGDGPRSIRLNLRDYAVDLIFTLEPNPHRQKAYNKHQEDFYKICAGVFVNHCLEHLQPNGTIGWPNEFNFVFFQCIYAAKIFSEGPGHRPNQGVGSSQSSTGNNNKTTRNNNKRKKR